jgi:hypothetical protein
MKLESHVLYLLEKSFSLEKIHGMNEAIRHSCEERPVGFQGVETCIGDDMTLECHGPLKRGREKHTRQYGAAIFPFEPYS